MRHAAVHFLANNTERAVKMELNLHSDVEWKPSNRRRFQIYSSFLEGSGILELSRSSVSFEGSFSKGRSLCFVQRCWLFKVERFASRCVSSFVARKAQV